MRRSAQIGALVAIVAAVLAFAFRQRLGISGWFEGASAGRDSTSPSELDADATERGEKWVATGAAERSGDLASRHG